MTDASHTDLLGERLIDAHEAVWHFNLPRYWLAQAKERQQRRIPHYRVGKLVRFKSSELCAWMEAQQASGGPS